MLVATALAVLLLGATPSGMMAAMVWHDRVSADYPSFHRVTGDVVALAAVRNSGVRGSLSGNWGMQDSIEIRRVTVLSSQEAHTFNLAEAARLGQAVRMVGVGIVSNGRPQKICGRTGYGFTTVGKDMAPMPNNHDRVLTAHAIVLVGHEVWQAQYTRLYDKPGLESTVGPQMIAFAGRYCVKPLGAR